MTPAQALGKERTLSGQVEITADLVRFTAGTETIELPLDDLKISRGGFNNGQIFLEHAAQPGWSVCVSDPKFLDSPALTQRVEIASQVKAMPKEHRRRGLVVAAAAVGAVIVGLIVALILSRDWLVQVIADRIPVSWEQNLGEQFFKDIKSKGQIVEGTKREQEIATLTAPLIQAVGETGYAFQFHVISDTNVNAFAVPGGHIFIHTGLLGAVETPEEIAGVLAHEIAHVTKRHGFRSIINAAGLFLIVQFFLGDTSGLMAVLADGSRFLLEQSYSRDFEREADDVGWDYLVKANVDPRGMIRFFNRLKAEEEKNPAMTGTLQLLNTHPASQERMERLERKWDKLERKTGFRELKAIPDDPPGERSLTQ